MILDALSLQLAAFLVILMSAVMYLLDTLMLKDGPPGRYWSAAYLAGTFSALCYLVGMMLPAAWVATAIGNGAFVSATGFIWLGCVAFNGRTMAVPSAVLATAVVVVTVAALAEGPTGGEWAGAIPFFLGNGLFAVLGAIETRRGVVGRRWSSVGLTAVLVTESLWFVSRSVVFVALGVDSDLFRAAFDTHIAAMLTIALVVAAVVVTSTLRSSDSAFRSTPTSHHLTIDRDGVLRRDSFRAALNILLVRARAAQEDPCVICLRIDDLRRVVMAFGPEEADAIVRAFRGAVRRHSPTMALVGETDTTGVTVAFVTTASTDVRRTVRVLHARVVEEVSALGTSVVPVVGTGLALASETGFNAEGLIARADSAAAEAVLTGEQPFGFAP